MAEPSLARKPWWRRWFGTRSERAASRFLKSLGYRIVARNWSCPLGELDLIANVPIDQAEGLKSGGFQLLNFNQGSTRGASE